MFYIILWKETRELSIISHISLVRICDESIRREGPLSLQEGTILNLKHDKKLFQAVVIKIVKKKKDAEDICNEKLRKSALATYMTDTDRQDSTDTGADTTDDDDDRRETPKKSTDDDHHEDPETPQHSKETKKSSTKDRVAVLEKCYQSLKRKLNALEDRLLDMKEKPREQNDAESNLIEKKFLSDGDDVAIGYTTFDTNTCVPTTWLVEVTKKCQGKGGFFLLTKLLEGLIHLYDLAGRTQKSFDGSAAVIITAIKSD
ncbi:unnamed protein product [Owenia fusiformis]|uniref:Uncharacterized protein n=1 Tax=Owenia fusiformis TaxID=6347 RepID=A0A8S4PVA8_OWEFU|nr:unnamed protein product [Owenia fusiformis]